MVDAARVDRPTLLNRSSVERMERILGKSTGADKGSWFVNICKTLRVPMTLKDNRKGIQMSILQFISLPVLMIRPIHVYMGIAATYFAYSSVQIVDNSCGGSMNKAIDRIGGAVLAFLMISPILVVLLIMEEDKTEVVKHNYWMRWSLVLFATLMCAVWGYMLYLFPNRRTLGTTGMSTLAFFTMTTNNTTSSYANESWRTQVVKLMVGRCGGYLVGLIFCVSVMRQLAQDMVINNLVKVSETIESILVPLIALDTGVVDSDAVDTDNILNMLIAHRGDEPRTIEFEKFMAIKKVIWEKIEKAYTLLEPNKLLLSSARVELHFPYNEYVELKEAMRALFFHVTSLYLILETHEAVLNKGINNFYGGEHLAWGSTLRVGDELVTIQQNKHPNIRKYMTDPVISSVMSNTGGGMRRLMFSAHNMFRGPEVAPPPTLQPTQERIVPPPSADVCTPRPAGKSVYDLSVLDVVEVIQHESCADSSCMQPMLRWTEVFGPLIGRISGNVAAVIAAITKTLSDREVDSRLYRSIAEVEKSLKDLCHARRQWQGCVEDMFKISLAEFCAQSESACRQDPAFIHEVIEKILGISVEHYRHMSVESRAALWSNLGLVRDKMARFNCIIIALSSQLNVCARKTLDFIRAR